MNNKDNNISKIKAIKKAQLQLKFGLLAIVFIGLAIAVYFVIFNPIEREDESNDNSGNWQTYTNEIHNFSFQYPANVKVTVDIPKREVDLKGPELDSGNQWPRFYIANFVGEDYRPTEEIDLKEWVTEKFDFDVFATDRQIAGLDAVHIDTIKNVHDDSLDRYYFLKDGQIFQVDILHVDGMVDWDIYNTFLDSITFDINSEEGVVDSLFTAVNTTDWVLFEDKANSYSIKYPSDYLIKTEDSGYVVFDSSLIDEAGLSYLHFSVTVNDIDMHTHRLGILTNEQVDNDSEILEKELTIDGLVGNKITLKNKLGETIIHYLVTYLGKTYDVSAGDSLSEGMLNAIISNFKISQFAEGVDITSTAEFLGKECVSNSDCGAFPCNPSNGKCLIKACTSDNECSAGTCGQYATPVPGYCTTIDVL